MADINVSVHRTDDRTIGEKVSDALNSAAEAVSEKAHQAGVALGLVERTPGEKLEHAGDEVKVIRKTCWDKT